MEAETNKRVRQCDGVVDTRRHRPDVSDPKWACSVYMNGRMEHTEVHAINDFVLMDEMKVVDGSLFDVSRPCVDENRPYITSVTSYRFGSVLMYAKSRSEHRTREQSGHFIPPTLCSFVPSRFSQVFCQLDQQSVQYVDGDEFVTDP